MKNWTRAALAFFAIAAGVFSHAQGGAGGLAGPVGGDLDRISQAINGKIARYLNGDEVRSILTPGEVTEWPLELKVDEVVVAEARSDVFDAALEIVDESGKSMAFNDDRWPGDQRPLLLWRCEKPGNYVLRAKCFQNKAGGPVMVRYKVYESFPVASEVWTEHAAPAEGDEILLRVPLAQDQMVQFETSTPNYNDYTSLLLEQAISPSGLPDADLLGDFRPVYAEPLRAPVSGDYYVLAHAPSDGHRKVRVRTLPIVAKPLVWDSKTGVQDTMASNQTGLWAYDLKAGDIIKISVPELDPLASVSTVPAPKTWTIDPKKPETNPFYPVSAVARMKEPTPFYELPGRDRDGRIEILRVLHDVRVFTSVRPSSRSQKGSTFEIKRADLDFPEGKPTKSVLNVGGNDYWSFDAKVGDVMNLSSEFKGYSQILKVFDPNGSEVANCSTLPDESTMKTTLIVQTPGRYLVQVSSHGGGGGGDYDLERHVLPAKEFSKGRPAVGEFADEKIQIWKFTARPGEPVLIHWTSSDWNYSVSVRDAEGHPTDLPLTAVDGNQKYGVLSVDKARDYLIVLTPSGSKAKYTLELTDLPGLRKG